MRVALAQINSTIGAFEVNAQKILDSTRRAHSKGADLVLFPELAVSGYPPMDLLDQTAFLNGNNRTLTTLCAALPAGITAGVGFVNRNPRQDGKPLVNSYALIQNRKIVFEQTKTLLPTYDVFDEARNFEPAASWEVFEICGERLGIAICEDVWRETGMLHTRYAEDPVRRLLDKGATLLAVPSASPFYTGKHQERLHLAQRIAARGNVPIMYVNAVGANDSIVFDGRSFCLANSTVYSAAAFAEDLLLADYDRERAFCCCTSVVVPQTPALLLPNDTQARRGVAEDTAESAANEEAEARGAPPPLYNNDESFELEEALVMGIRDYMAKCGFTQVHLGLSGGIDSALAAYLAVRAAGAENVAALSMPSRFSSQGSKDDAAELARNLGCRYETLPIEGVFTAFLETLAPVFGGRPFDLAEENLQARIRGSLLMAYSNKWNSMLLTTGNKSELAMGYCTLYGDVNGALAPIGDIFKTEVFALCRAINSRATAQTGKPVIPPAIIEKPPSAELRPNQKDEDSLPPYNLLDEILRLYLFENLSAPEIAARGYDLELAVHIVRTVARAEFKRRQSPPVLKVSPRAFGMGRRMPIARAIYEV
ncbi:MAG: NAD+ synthase [Spirochaetaceae bacterium]|jgi:NAD+ synthase (glutamine-hydrolysing)|nr:NAD+ synthase [Spirochaetaceae bacterium]